jgi:ADP-ribose pyrophosphatase YjhB (NUDIX family)
MAVLHGWRLCPRCGAELDLARAPGRVTCPACGFAAYANPKPAANAFVVDAGGRVLLARRAVEPSAGLWDLPGGFVEEGEHPVETLRRELREETGLEIEPETFAGMWMDVYGDGPDAESTLCLYWTARPVSGELHPADDVSELAWFAADELPAPSDLAFPSVAEALAAWRDMPA